MSTEANTTPSQKGKKKWVVPVAILVILALIGLSWWGWRIINPAGNSSTIVPLAEQHPYTTGELSESISVDATVNAQTVSALYTSLTGPIASINAKVGDRVNQNQLLATIDTSNEQAELDGQVASRDAARAAGQRQVAAAQMAVDQANELDANGLNAEINGARSALISANQAYDEAKADFESALRDHNDNSVAVIRSQQRAVEGAHDAMIDTLISGVGEALGIRQQTITDVATLKKILAEEKNLEYQDPAVNGTNLGTNVVSGVGALRRIQAAAKDIDRAEQDLQQATEEADDQLAKLNRAVENARLGVQDATVSMHAAEISARHQKENLIQQRDAAVADANASDPSAQSAINQLVKDINSSEVRAPFNGIVTAVAAKQGQAATGPLITVADDSKYILKSSVEESDLAEITVGDKVTFTTTITGDDKQFTGKVVHISPVSAAQETTVDPEEGHMSAPSQDQAPTFPIEIEVTGNTEGLRIGGTADVDIITTFEDNVHVAPRDAIGTDEDGSEFVLVAVDNGGTHTIERRAVTTGTSNDFDVVITGGDLEEGDIMLSPIQKYELLEGQSVQLGTEEGTDPVMAP